MGWVFRRPSIVALEIAWRWLFGIPLLLVCWREGQRILAAVPPSSTGLANLDAQNPWVAAVQLAGVWDQYAPHLAALAAWLMPAAAIAWVLISGVGRAAVLKRIEPGLSFRPLGMIALQTAWLAVAGADLLGLVPVDAVGGGDAHHCRMAKRIWSATRSGRFFSRWASLRCGRW